MSRSNLFLGLLLVAVGALLLLHDLEVVDAWSVVSAWWPSIIVVAGIGPLVTRPRNVVGGMLLVTIGGVLLLSTLDIIDGVGLLWPLLLIVVGAWLLVGRRMPGGSRRGTRIDVVALFDDRRNATSGAFAGGEIVTIFGDVTEDLRDVTPEAAELMLKITTIFGDVDLEIPESWDVRVSGPEVFGDVNLYGRTEKRVPEAVLRIQVVTIFGDVNIRTSAPAAV